MRRRRADAPPCAGHFLLATRHRARRPACSRATTCRRPSGARSRATAGRRPTGRSSTGRARRPARSPTARCGRPTAPTSTSSTRSTASTSSRGSRSRSRARSTRPASRAHRLPDPAPRRRRSPGSTRSSGSPPPNTLHVESDQLLDQTRLPPRRHERRHATASGEPIESASFLQDLNYGHAKHAADKAYRRS